MYGSFGKGNRRCNARALSETLAEDAVVSARVHAAITQYRERELRARRDKLERKLAAVQRDLDALCRDREATASSSASSPSLSKKSTSLPRLLQGSNPSLIAELNSTLLNTEKRTKRLSNVSLGPHASAVESGGDGTELSHAVSTTSLVSLPTLALSPGSCDLEEEGEGDPFQVVLDTVMEDDTPKMKEKRIIQFETLRQEEGETPEKFLTRLQRGVIDAYGSELMETLYRRVAWGFIRGLADTTLSKFIVRHGWTKSETETMSPAELIDLVHEAPLVRCEGFLKRKIVHLPAQVKVETKSWATFYVVLRDSILYFYKDHKSAKECAEETACALTQDSTIEIEDDKKKKKILKISKQNGLEMLLKSEKNPPIDSWLDAIRTVTKSPTLRSNDSFLHEPEASPIDVDNNFGVDEASVLESKEVIQKRISNFIKNRPGPDSKQIQDILTNQGIDILHFTNLDKEKKKKALTMLLSKRPAYHELEKKGYIKYTVIGCPIGALCTRQGTQVPRVVTQCVEAIEYRGLKSNGLYRISGNSASIQKLRFKFDREEPVDLRDSEYDVNMLTGLLKLFLRELPEPIIPYSDFPVIEKSIKSPDMSEEDVVTTIRNIVHSLPEANRMTFKYLIHHLARVVKEKSENQMDEHNLSIIFGPSLLGNHPDKSNLLVDLPIQNKAIEIVIRNYKTVLREQ